MGGQNGADGGTLKVINFDSIVGDVSNQYAPAATFSSTPGTMLYRLGYGSYFNSSPPYILCSDGCAKPVYVDFGTPVRSLTFRAVGVTSVGVVARVRVLRQATVLATVDIVGLGQNTTPVPVSLAAYDQVTRIEVVDVTDSYGIGLDDFSFIQ